MYIISACLMGENCKYNGENNRTQWVLDFVEDQNVIAVCPEELECDRNTAVMVQRLDDFAVGRSRQVSLGLEVVR